MLFMKALRSDDHLKNKTAHIVITNVCNLTCGGCHQHCGNFEKSQLWLISPEEFASHIWYYGSEGDLVRVMEKEVIGI